MTQHTEGSQDRDETNSQTDEQVESDLNRPSFIFTIGFNDLSMRNKIFFLGKKNKNKLPRGVIFRDNMTSPDYKKCQKAKPQMAKAYGNSV